MKLKLLPSFLTGFLLLAFNMASAQWETVYFGDMPAILYGVDFKDFYHGVTCGYSDNGINMDRGMILRTADNGSTWDTVLMTGGHAAFRDIEYTDASTIIAVGEYTGNQGIIARSADDGASWDTILIADELYWMSFPSEQIGYATGTNGNLYKTIDEGLNWTQLSTGFSVGIYQLFFLNDTLGFAFTDSMVIKTENGGNLWIGQIIPGYEKDVYFPSVNVGYLYSTNGFDSVSVYRSTDLGSSWQMIATVFMGWSAFLCNMDFVNDSVGYFCGYFQIQKSIDGGLTWTPQSATPPSIPNFMDFVSEMCFLNADTGFACGAGVFYRTANGGAVIISVPETTDREILIFPNPFTDATVLRFIAEKDERYSLGIFDLDGHKMREIAIANTGKAIIERKGLKSGLYLYVLRNSTGTVGSGKLMVQ